MSDLDYWTKMLKAAERALDAATTRTALNAAAKKFMLAKGEAVARRQPPRDHRMLSCGLPIYCDQAGGDEVG